MRTLVSILAGVAIAFMAVVGFVWAREGSLEDAGRHIDREVEALNESTKPIQREVEDIGEATVESVEKAVDGDDRT